MVVRNITTWLVVVSTSGSILHMHVFSFFMRNGGKCFQKIPEPVEENPLRFHSSLISNGAGEAEAFLLSLCTILSPFFIFSFHPPHSIFISCAVSCLGPTFPAFLSPQFVFTLEENT